MKANLSHTQRVGRNVAAEMSRMKLKTMMRLSRQTRDLLTDHGESQLCVRLFRLGVNYNMVSHHQNGHGLNIGKEQRKSSSLQLCVDVKKEGVKRRRLSEKVHKSYWW